MASFPLGVDHLGKRRRLLAYAKSKSEAKRELQTLRTRAGQGLRQVDHRTKVATFCHDWVENIAPQTTRDTTATHYRWLLDKYVLPYVGELRLDELTPERVGEMLLKLRASGLSVTTVRRARGVLNIAMNYAVRTRRLSWNPVSAVRAPLRTDQDPKPNVGYLELMEAQRLLEAVVHHPLDGIVIVAMCLGLRLGEVLGLKWVDVNWTNGTLQIDRTLKEARRRAPDGTYLVELKTYAPKTTKSRRSLGISPTVRESLKRTQAVERRSRMKAGAAWEDTGYIFVNAVGGPLYPSNVRRRYYRLLEQAEVRRVRFHDLRHTAAVLMLQAEAPLEAVTQALGHSSISITKDIYAPEVPELADRAIARLDQLLTGSDEGSEFAATSAGATPRRPRSGRAGASPRWRGE